MDLLKKITEELNETGKTCEDIAHEYDKNPELVYLLPTIKETYEGEDGIDKDYNIILDEENIKEPINIKRNLGLFLFILINYTISIFHPHHLRRHHYILSFFLCFIKKYIIIINFLEKKKYICIF